MLEKLQTYKLQPTKFYEKGHWSLNRGSRLLRCEVIGEVAFLAIFGSLT